MLTRFAPSPTGLLHVGNVRTALVNYLMTRKAGGQFLLRIDDTDLERSKPEYVDAIKQDMEWMGMHWDRIEHQSARFERYKQAKEELLAKGRLYACYETPDELAVKRKMLLSRGLPPIYDRSGLKLTEEKKKQYESEGRTPHFRFLLEDKPIEWDDAVRGATHFEGQHLSDPIIIRADGSMTYMLCTVIDDIDFGVTHVVRGEDHVSNTAMHVQMFEALSASASPNFAHLALLKGSDTEISKRSGGFDIRELREEHCLESIAIASYLATIGTSNPIQPFPSMDALIEQFDIGHFGRSPAIYSQEELLHLNHKLLAHLSYDDVKHHLETIGMTKADETFWLSVRPNVNTLSDVKPWWDVCKNPLTPVIDDAQFLAKASELLPDGEWDDSTWKTWTSAVKDATGANGKSLFMPLRKALTGQEAGPELKHLLPLIGRERALKRLNGEVA